MPPNPRPVAFPVTNPPSNDTVESEWIAIGDTVTTNSGDLVSQTPVYTHSICNYPYVGSNPPDTCPLCFLKDYVLLMEGLLEEARKAQDQKISYLQDRVQLMGG